MVALYRVMEDNHLKFEILRNDTLNIAMSGTIPFDPLPLYDGFKQARN